MVLPHEVHVELSPPASAFGGASGRTRSRRWKRCLTTAGGTAAAGTTARNTTPGGC